uniref:Ergosterol biosynthetic protein 28 n=1 Tax=Romanomermis culicivorax TaxID=13658 RepID=A0A915L094_ROMCU
MNINKFARSCVTISIMVSLGNFLQIFASEGFLRSKIYDKAHASDVSQLLRRHICIWQLFLAIIQLAYVVAYDNRALRCMVLLTNLTTVCHYLFEILLYKTATLNTGILVNMIISSLAVILLTLCFVAPDGKMDDKICTNKEEKLLAKAKRRMMLSRKTD